MIAKIWLAHQPRTFPIDTKGACIYDLKLALDVRPGTRGEQNLPEGKLAVIVVGPMLGTNLLSTSLIAWKAWCAAHPRGDLLPFLSTLLTDCLQGSPPSIGYASQKRQPFGAGGEDSRASDRVRLRILPHLGNPPSLHCPIGSQLNGVSL